LRLTQIKLAGFKSFVDPTTIATPGQLVGIVGPNGCGKSNVIDAVRWVLGESKASALRGESMQDVIFNGAGDRAPVGRASVELNFDNSLGRIGGQWGQYSELSIKRILARDGDSTYYINNIPVRRRDIYDLFLGTGLGPRAYAIIEQGMISRVIEAKPEELRVFLEEAAGVSKYRERRKETEGRLSDTRENLARVEDIRVELGNQLVKLEQQALVAAQYRELEARAKQAQQLLWFARHQDAARNRDRCAAELANLNVAFEAEQAQVRAAESKLETLRAEHFSAGDTLHAKQGAFYEANALVTRLEQQLSFARESATRITQQVAQLTEALATIAGQEIALRDERLAAERSVAEALIAHERSVEEEKVAQAALPELDSAVAVAGTNLASWRHQHALTEQNLRVAETKADAIATTLAQFSQRRERLSRELASFARPATDPIHVVAEQLAQESSELAGKRQTFIELQQTLESLLVRQRETDDVWQQASKRLSDLEARSQALAALQATIGRGQEVDAWLAQRGLTDARRFFELLDIDPGWENALEAVLRERLGALELDRLDDVTAWLTEADPPARRVAAYARSPETDAVAPAADSLLAKVRGRHEEVSRSLADGLAGVRCRPDLSEALAERARLAVGETIVTPAGHLVSAQGVVLFAPEGDVHGVLARQRELEGLATSIEAAARDSAAAVAARDSIDAQRNDAQQTYHAESLALNSQQRRVHDLEIELTQLRQSAEAAELRHAQLTQETTDVTAEAAAELSRCQLLAAEIADLQSGAHEGSEKIESLRLTLNETEAAQSRGRERMRSAERATQEASFAERNCRDRLADLERRLVALSTQAAQQNAQLSQLTRDHAAIDWTPVEQSLQAALGARGHAEQALAAARDRLEALSTALRAAEEERLAAEQGLDPARIRIEDMRLKEQAAVLAQAQFAEQLAEAHANLTLLPGALAAWGSPRTLPAEIERATRSLAELGAVNLAALDELTQAKDRKAYLDAQATDLTEAMSTLEAAIRQIDRESRQLLQQTFDLVNKNFARLFPLLFGGGQARLVLTGEEILDSGVQVVAQPPGKRNTSIHLLSGGEKAMPSIALVFALFAINPAPFCLLDEVDAPLDDPNTERFCRMVRDMATQTQFLFISHNKITMEMAQQLVGITMPEPGASRVVAVDIAEALTLAENAA